MPVLLRVGQFIKEHNIYSSSVLFSFPPKFDASVQYIPVSTDATNKHFAVVVVTLPRDIVIVEKRPSPMFFCDRLVNTLDN